MIGEPKDLAEWSQFFGKRRPSAGTRRPERR
jgi:hypothetical protein